MRSLVASWLLFAGVTLLLWGAMYASIVGASPIVVPLIAGAGALGLSYLAKRLRLVRR